MRLSHGGVGRWKVLPPAFLFNLESSRMRLFLIRHGETVDNIANVYAGVRDSELTIHGSLQASRLAEWFARKRVEFTTIFSSDLQRAYKTAGAIRKAQLNRFDPTNSRGLEVRQVRLLQEQDFGSYEGKPFSSRTLASKVDKQPLQDEQSRQPVQDVESKESMDQRMTCFLDGHLLPLLSPFRGDQRPVVAIVSHGIALGSLWRCLMRRFAIHSICVASDVSLDHRKPGASLEYLGGWSNTGFLELDIKRLVDGPEIVDAGSIESREIVDPPTMSASTVSSLPSDIMLYSWTMTIKAINSKEHLSHLKRTRGGVGSSAYDGNQKTLETFFKKAKT